MHFNMGFPHKKKAHAKSNTENKRGLVERLLRPNPSTDMRHLRTHPSQSLALSYAKEILQKFALVNDLSCLRTDGQTDGMGGSNTHAKKHS